MTATRILLLILFLHAAAARAGEVIRACAADIEYPPYAYSSGRADKGMPQAQGVGIDVLRRILERTGKETAEVSLLPWKRCLKMAETGAIDVVINVPTAQIDPTPFLISEPYADVHSMYYVSRRNHPDGIRIRNLGNLRSYKICGLIGNTYESYGIPTESVDRGAKTYLALVDKLHAGHCDLFIEKREVMEGLVRFNADLTNALGPAQIAGASLPEDAPIGLHFAISKRSRDAGRLLERIDDEITALRSSKSVDRMLKKHLGGRH
ncbi:substrate-binding periplasmic protein [Noviherbaspirillum galbum]|uniref:Transporter substrate-binding domain-containing protein n=1 Tax=Noviherbaspirillum galbum TaxID=2709383 RepID=A0A6B3SLQ5_9BURK|nr:transporter substrate-binding domain-containing protein [Noviherbaspirillum galbum]NEX61743.1 transporter substrate-binding domain-containing protein [Noviherbaspirillum galbum]